MLFRIQAGIKLVLGEVYLKSGRCILEFEKGVCS
jgi:hypothetical protein